MRHHAKECPAYFGSKTCAGEPLCYADAKYHQLTNDVSDMTASAEKAERERDEARAQSQLDRSMCQTMARLSDQDKAVAKKAKYDLETAEHKVAMLEAEVQQLREQSTKLTTRDLNNFATLCMVASERDDAREQMAKVEWAGTNKFLSLACCLVCHGIKPDAKDEIRKTLLKDVAGHRPTCWYVRQGVKKEPGNGELARNDDKPAGVPETYLYISMSPPSRPEPKFKVGQKVNCEVEPRTFTVTESKWKGGWQYRESLGNEVWWAESVLRPTPRFAVGEWVTHRYGAGEVMSREWAKDLNCWSYQVTGILSEVETGLAAQTPQYKHDCAGVFLGRHDGADLYLEKDMRTYLAVWSNDGCYFSCSAPIFESLIEARRRAVARGLVR